MAFSIVRETIDYAWVVARQLDRVAEAATQIDPSSRIGAPFKHGLLRYAVALLELYNLAQPVARRRVRLPDYEKTLMSIIGELTGGRSSRPLVKIWLSLNEIHRELLRALDIEGLLVRRSEIGVET